MLRNYIYAALRNFRNNGFYTFLNITGLAVGLATCLIILLYVFNELGYDSYNTNEDRIFRIDREAMYGSSHYDNATVNPAFGPVAARDFPQVEKYTRLFRTTDMLVKKGKENIWETKVIWADSTIFDVFTLPMLYGDPKTALTDPRGLVITESVAKKYFGRTDVVGQNMVFNTYSVSRITGVIKDIPQQSHFNFDFFFPLMLNAFSRNDNWFGSGFFTYLLLKKGTDPKQFEEQLNRLEDGHFEETLQKTRKLSLAAFRQKGNSVHCSLMPLNQIHLHSNKLSELGANGSIQIVYLFSAIAGLILLIACVNFINLSTARAASRAREVGIRKVLGSVQKNLILQFLTESLLMSVLAMVLAIIIVWPLLAFFDQLTGRNISYLHLLNPLMAVSFLLLILAVGLLAGFYPAFFLSRFQPIKVLQGKLAEGFKGSALRNALVIFQFTITIILIIGTIFIYNQLNYIQHRDIGFNRNQVMVLRGANSLLVQAPRIKTAFGRIVGVEDITVSNYLPVKGQRLESMYYPTPSPNPKAVIRMQQWSVDEHYVPAMQLTMERGRNFSPQFSTDSTGIILNEAASKLIGAGDVVNKKMYRLDSAGQKQLSEFHVIGVVKDFNFSSLRKVVTPLCLILQPQNADIAVRITSANSSSIISQMSKIWKELAPNAPFDYTFMDDDFNNLYATERRTGVLLIAFTLLTVLIGCLGLFGLVTYAVEQRTKEIGIRKVLGASISSISAMLVKEFMGLVLIASLIAIPIAWFAVNKWLQDFAYRISIAWWVFIMAAIVAQLIAVMTISFKAFRAARANPVDSLRTE